MQNVLKQTVVKALSTAIATLFLLVLVTGSAFGQADTGQIIGRVTDPNGAAVPGATVTVKSIATGAERTATAGDDGVYTITNLQPGLYDVTTQGGSFAATTQRVEVSTGGKVSLESKLGIQQIAGSVDVVAAGGVEVNTTTQELSNVVSGTQIRELPTLTRNAYDLVGISGNVNPDNASGRGTGFSINGQRSASTNILLDGGENVDNFTAVVGQNIPLDAVAEFRVITSNFSAEYGRASGGIVNVTTRPGTNEFHGTLYAFNRVSRLASAGFAINALGNPKPLFVRNQFGYSVGGRIIKDKLFFFNSTEWTRVRSSTTLSRLVPAAELIAGSNARTQAIFAGASLAATPSGTVFTIRDVCTGLNLGSGSFCGTVLPVSATNPTYQFIAPGVLPISTVALREVRQTIPADAGGGSPQNSYSTTTRIDWNFSDSTQLYGRYAIENQGFFEGSNANSPWAGFNTGATTFNQNAILNLTHAFTPSLVSQTKLVFNRLNQNQPLGAQPVQPTYFLRNNVVATFQGRRIALTGYLPFSPGSGIPFGGPQNLGQIFQDISSTMGKHAFRFGGTYVYMQDNRTFGAYQNAVAAIGTTSYTGGFNNFVNGNLQRLQVAVDPQGQTRPGTPVTLPVRAPSFTRNNLYNEWAAYFNDSYRATSRLTLNLGIRYEYYGVQHNKVRSLDSNFYYGAGATPQAQVQSGQIFVAQNSPIGGLWAPDKNNFAPRLGFAWDVNGDGKTSIRGGYGMAYERNFGNVTFNVIQNAPAYAVVTVNPGDPGFPTIPIPPPTNNFGPLGGSTGTALLPGRLNVRHVNENIKNAYAHFWSLAFEREVWNRTVASVEYSGSAGRKLYDLTNDNRIGAACIYLGASQCFTAANPIALLNSSYYPLNTRGNKGFSDYNAMIASLESGNLRNLGLQFTARYTLSQTRDNLSSTFSESSNNFNLGFLDPFDPKLDYGYADFDTRHRFAASFNWEVPYFKNDSSSFVKHALGGWSFTGILNVRSGQPFSIFDCTNAIFEVCPRLVPTAAVPAINSNPPGSGANQFTLIDLSNQTPGNYIDPLTGTGEFGPFPLNMTKRNQFRGPGLWNVDFATFKNFHITENTRLQLRGEFYNVFNHANMFVDGASSDVTEGQVTGFKDGRRNVQLAVKFIF
ncbi:MAG: carboxypeptidase regulatory-like domain-containing protein [Pyrinomonadaceae bacterium]